MGPMNVKPNGGFACGGKLHFVRLAGVRLSQTTIGFCIPAADSVVNQMVVCDAPRNQAEAAVWDGQPHGIGNSWIAFH